MDDQVQALIEDNYLRTIGAYLAKPSGDQRIGASDHGRYAAEWRK
ncbi:hypothetical protein [Paenibacillus agaridevorans]|nr:hypothetical protein [Paenibacillus agaridevorans]